MMKQVLGYGFGKSGVFLLFRQHGIESRQGNFNHLIRWLAVVRFCSASWGGKRFPDQVREILEVKRIYSYASIARRGAAAHGWQSATPGAAVR